MVDNGVGWWCLLEGVVLGGYMELRHGGVECLDEGALLSVCVLF